MISKGKLSHVLLAGVAATVLAACSDTTIASPGVAGSPPTSPPPPPPATSAVDVVPASGCYTGTTSTTLDRGTPSDTTDDIVACALTGVITADVTIPADAIVALSGNVQVGEDGGTSATLTIRPGAVLFGSSGADFLVVNRGSQIQAEGSVSSPIIMTSASDLNNGASADSGDAAVGAITDTTVRGEWGGLILNGDAPINACDDATATGGTAACVKSGEGSTGEFGGADPADDSGTLRYLQVRYAGFEITPDNELNGIAFQGTGSGTEVEFIQVYNNADDGVEFFGGTTNASYVALNGNGDDSLDYTDGWVGSAQFVLVQHTDDADQGFEFDNNGDDNAATPRSNPTISNFTIVGDAADSDIGVLIREGSGGTFVNGVVTGPFSAGALNIDNTETFDRLGAGTEPIVLGSLLLDATVGIIENDEEDAGGNPIADPFDLSDFIDTNFSDVVEDTSTLANSYFPGMRELSIPTVDPVSLGGFFVAADAIGAFRTTDLPDANWATGWTFNLVADGTIGECPAGTTDTGEEINGQSVCELTGVVRNDLELSPGVLYELVGNTQIGADVGADGSGGDPAILTINPGVTIFGSDGADFLVVNRGSQIRANGTVDAPITMTARVDVEGLATSTTRGAWGGLIINGRAPINACDSALATGGAVDCVKAGEGSTGEFGGALSTDNSGNIFYTIVKYAGNEITPDNELNGIAFQGVGSQTDVDFVQVHNNADDGVEFFGGTVDASHVVLTGNRDDSIDWTDGWIGSLQFGIVQHKADDADQAIEADNNGDDNTALPRSNPTLSNLTLIGQVGGDSDIGILLREGTDVKLVNTIAVDFNEGGLDVDQAETFNRLALDTGAASDLTTDPDGLVLRSIFLDNVTNILEGDEEDAGGNPIADPADLSDGLEASVVTGTSDLSGTTLVTGAQGLVPGTNITGAVAAVDPQAALGLEPGAYLGAVEDVDDTWYQGWTFTD